MIKCYKLDVKLVYVESWYIFEDFIIVVFEFLFNILKS